MTSSVNSLSSASISSAITTVQKRLQKPITALQTEAAGEQAQISAWGSIQGTISSLSAALSNIANVGSVNSRVATTSASTVATATAAASAAAGTYDLSSITLAKKQEIYSQVKGSAGTVIGTGLSAGSLNFTLTSGKTEKVVVGSGSQTLSGIASAINNLAGPVQASVIGTSTGARLVLQSASAGSANGFSFTGGGGLAGLSYSASASGSFTVAQPARSAALEINGVPITSASNVISSAISGLTVNLLASGAATITVASSGGGIANNLSAVATTLNAATAAIAKNIKYVPPSSSASATTAVSGPLLGNFTAAALSNNLLSAVAGAAASGLSANAIGFSVGAAGKVTFNSGTFAAAYAANPSGVAALVNKIYTSLNSVTSAAIGSGSASGSSNAASTGKRTGSIGAQTLALQAEITALGAQEVQIAKTNNAALQILVQQYTKAESASTNAQVTQAYLSIFTNTSSSGSG